ncbi:MAG: hypothetical protein ABW168_26235 [Sedimenticola sp.]
MKISNAHNRANYLVGTGRAVAATDLPDDVRYHQHQQAGGHA